VDNNILKHFAKIYLSWWPSVKKARNVH